MDITLLSDYLDDLRPYISAQGIVPLTRIETLVACLTGFADAWQRIKELYESGDTPKAISLRYQHLGIHARQISQRAKRERWKSARRGRLVQVKHVKGFMLTCMLCNQVMHSTHGNKQICDVCTAKKIEHNEAIAFTREQAKELNRKGA